jgi:hypothetical protein
MSEPIYELALNPITKKQLTEQLTVGSREKSHNVDRLANVIGRIDER